MSKFDWSFWTALVCWVLAIIGLGISLWEHDATAVGAWVSAVCGWNIVLMRSRDD